MTSSRGEDRRWQRVLGLAAEDLAARYLEARGCRIVSRRYRCRRGEIDLVARDGRTIVFVEVKARRPRGHGAAAEAVTATKQRRLLRTARRYLRQHGGAACPCRFDVVTIEVERGRARVAWIKDAFTA